MRLPLVFAGLLFAFVLTTGAQVSPTEAPSEKEKAAQELEKEALKLAQQSVTEAGGLKLWQNRALINALAADLFWKTDQKKARSLFRDAASELVLGIQIPKEKAQTYFEDYDFWRDVSPRRTILLLVAAYDAELALEMLLETRPPDLEAAIEAYNQPPVLNPQNKTQVQMINEQKSKYKAQQEIQLEQQFAVKAAERDPKKAAKIIRDSLAKGFSRSIADLLAKINEKDEKLGGELLKEILQKLIDADFKQKEDARNLGIQFLSQSFSAETIKARNPKFKLLKIEDRDLKMIAAKLADFYLQETSFREFFQFSQMVPMLEKYAPEKASLLRQKETEIDKLIPDEMKGWREAEKLRNDPNATADKLIEEADKYAGWEKDQLYRAAVDKAFAAGTGEKLREKLQNMPDSKQRSDALDYLDSKTSDKAIKDDKLDDVRKIVGKSASDSAKINLLVNLALGYQRKNTEESHKVALDLIAEARRLVGDIPESREEVKDFLKIVAGYAEIEPDKAFPLLSSLADMANDMLTAYALLSKYNKSENMFKQGEMIFTQSLGFGGTFLGYGKELKLLAAADLDKTRGAIDQLRRDDIKILMRILLAQSILKERMAAEINQPFYTYEEY